MINALDVKRNLENILNFTRGAHSVAGFAARETLGQIIEAVDNVCEGLVEQDIILDDKTNNEGIYPRTLTNIMDINASIEILNLPVRLRNCLFAENINTIKKLLLWSRKQLQRIPNLGKKSFCDLELILEQHGLRLKDE